MLLLTRKPGQYIQIGDDIRVHFIHLGRGQVKVGIEAPPEVNIVRNELLERDEQELDK